MNDLEERTFAELAQIKETLGQVLALMVRIASYEPMLAEAARRMEGPMRWRRQSG